jgi:hypothetical protein
VNTVLPEVTSPKKIIEKALKVSEGLLYLK